MHFLTDSKREFIGVHVLCRYNKIKHSATTKNLLDNNKERLHRHSPNDV